MEITPKILERHGLSEEEYHRIVKILGRDPNWVELGVFSVMWSEHCSYKSSRVHLKKFPTTGKSVLQGPGENAGVVDIGDGFAAVFKMESHNHPSFIEPYQGAATGVGGILRDIFTMGARPVALLDSLRFGDLSQAKGRYLMHGVVSGISGYGNCVGIPTIGGEVYCDEIYNQNILVNVMALGIARKDRIFKGVAQGAGNPILYFGARTGRDGIHGATMASESFDEKSEEKRPTVQVGDPFTEKLLLEACLEIMEKGLVIGIQDMGAAGLTSSSCEMAGRGGTGVEIHVDRVPRREEGMTPYEVMLSESQERMLMVAPKGKEDDVIGICRKWGLEAVVVGRVTDDGNVRVLDGGIPVAEIPARALTEEAPVYQRPEAVPPYQDAIRRLDLRSIPLPRDYNAALLTLLVSPTIASKEWIYRQYDHMVRTNTVVLPGSDAAVIRIKGTGRALALTTDCNSRYCFLDPYLGAGIAVAEAARNLVCSGARPLALTDCLNFGSPENPGVMWQFRQAVEGISAACRKLEIPVIGGNVSFYNETRGLPIYPTPIIGMAGLIEDVHRTVTQGFKGAGDAVLLLGKTREELVASEYLKEIHHQVRGEPPILDMDLEKKIQEFCLEVIGEGRVHSAHDLSEGGLAVALAECCIASPEGKIGAEMILDPETERESLRLDALLFGESQSRILLTVLAAQSDDLVFRAQVRGIPCRMIGLTGGEKLMIRRGGEGDPLVDLPVERMAAVWSNAIPILLGETVSHGEN
ncbi:MAG: phosphoribosylformylglycinamidine synthase subunit PurL [Nitrospirae bacterium]|nr:phosphoribosylformylglycinamidine synthase subunit PurL [Nitrospirota bacterium]